MVSKRVPIVGSLTCIPMTTQVALDYIASVRTIWPGHRSTASDMCLRSDMGMWHIHRWAGTLVYNPKRADLTAPPSGDKPAESGDKPDVSQQQNTFFPHQAQANTFFIN